VFDQVANKLGAPLIKLSSPELKNIQVPNGGLPRRPAMAPIIFPAWHGLFRESGGQEELALGLDPVRGGGRLSISNEAARSQRFYLSPYHLALVYAALGENAQAIEWLEKGFAERTFWLIHLKQEPAFDRLRPELGFQQLLKKMNLDK